MRVNIALELVAVVVAVLAATAVADRLRVSAPLLLLVVGIAGSYLPFVSAPQLSSEVVLFGFLPPLLYAAALRTSVLDFRHNLRPIGFLSVVLVVLTALGVGLVSWLVLPVSFPVALAFGAVVAPPDAVAATAIARRVGLPRSMVTILEGESLVNDATAITTLRVALAAIGGTFTAWTAIGGFLIAALGGVAVGLAVTGLAIVVRRRVREPVFDTAISFLVPFAAYLPAEEIGYGELRGSGVIAVVTAGLLLGHKSAVIQTGRSRLSERINWATIQFLLEHTVFLLIGLQAHSIVTAMMNSDLSGARIVGFCAAALAAVMLIRLGWVAVSSGPLFRRHRDNATPEVPWSKRVVVGWAGMRGVVTLATALLIPEEVPLREVLVFGAMVVTAGTLLVQGSTLPALVRALRLEGPDVRSDALQAATMLQTSAGAALRALDDLRRPGDSDDVVDRLRERIGTAPDRLWEKLGSPQTDTPADQYRRLRLETLQVQRDEVLKARSSGTVDHDVVEAVLGSFDVEESMLTAAGERSEDLDGPSQVRTPVDPIGPCGHLERAPLDVGPDSDGHCQDCLREGTEPVHLRICLSCGNVGCCDSSVGRHAERHHHTTEHPVMRSFEPGESWRWCYVDARLG